jgi:membrane-associated protein
MQAINDFILAAAGQPWVLFLVLACCVIDGFFPPIPSESVVVGLAAVAATADVPNPWLLMLVAALGAFSGDNIAYVIGRRVGTRRWAWMRGPRMQGAFHWAGRELRKRPASLILVARFVPIGRVPIPWVSGCFSASGLRTTTSWAPPSRSFVPSLLGSWLTLRSTGSGACPARWSG